MCNQQGLLKQSEIQIMIHIKNTKAGFPVQTKIMHAFNTIQMMEILNFYQIGTHKKYFVYHTSMYM